MVPQPQQRERALRLDKLVDPLPQFRQFSCPGCGLLIENEIAIAEDPVLKDVELKL